MKASLDTGVARIFRDAGYKVVSCEGIQSSFDILAKGEGKLFLVKTFSNVEGLNPKMASELSRISGILDAIPLIVAERIKSTLLEEGVLYERYGVNVVGLRTLDHILDHAPPTTYTVRGNYCMRVNPRRLACLRKMRGFTQDGLARLLGVSKQSVYRYECGGRVSSDIAERMSEVFKEAEGLFISNDFSKNENVDLEAEFQGYVSDLKRRTFHFFQDMGFSTSITKAPFDMILRDEEIVFTAVSNDWRRLERKIKVVEDLSNTLDCLSVTITERKKKVQGHVLKPKELKGIKSSREFISLLH